MEAGSRAAVRAVDTLRSQAEVRLVEAGSRVAVQAVDTLRSQVEVRLVGAGSRAANLVTEGVPELG